MKMKAVLLLIVLTFTTAIKAQRPDQPVLITLKNGETINAVHFGQLKCGKEVYSSNYIIIKGKYTDIVTEIKEYKDIEKIVLEGYTEPPATTVGNQKGTLRIFKKDGVSVTLEEAELVMSCYGPGDKYNEITVKIINPLTEQPSERTIEVREIQSIIFK
ncbi:MAG: hypothetical protein JW894_12255 [Bacteroidales bacterium]|nr:hypothetical protein [Bacteroidales bacterium]